jgi:hypothetical protein
VSEPKHDTKELKHDTFFCRGGCGRQLDGLYRQRRYCDPCRLTRRRDSQRAADARRRAKRREATRKCATGCGSPISGDPRVHYCKKCANERRRAGQVRRWANAPNRREVRRCALAGCLAKVVRPRQFCCRKHYGASRLGVPRPDLRSGQTVLCGCDLPEHKHPAGWCRVEVGYLRPSRADRAKRHICTACLPDWRRCRPPRPKTPPRGECGHAVSKPNVTLCKQCRATAGRRQYKASQIQAGIDELHKKGREVTVSAIARKAKVSRDSVYRWLHKAPEAPLLAEHEGQGTARGHRIHVRRRETSCRPCRDAWNADRRARYRARKAGQPLPRKPRRDAARCGTLSGYVGHRRRRETACPACIEACRRYTAEYRSRNAARL